METDRRVEGSEDRQKETDRDRQVVCVSVSYLLAAVRLSAAPPCCRSLRGGGLCYWCMLGEEAGVAMVTCCITAL